MQNENYGNQFFTSVPKKQAKSYEIELGQNEGAYKEELLIRYGDNTINHMMNKKQQGTKMNMEDIMRMNEQLKPFQERPKFEGQKSFAIICEELEDNFGNMDERSSYLTKFEEDLRQEIDEMTESIFKLFDETQKEFEPQLYEKYKELKTKIKEQKDENANLMKQLDLLMQENSQIMDMVYKVGSRLENLEKKVGIEKEEEQSQQLALNNEQEEEEKEMDEMEDMNELENQPNDQMNPVDIPKSEDNSQDGGEEAKFEGLKPEEEVKEEQKEAQPGSS